MRKSLLFSVLFLLVSILTYAQKDTYWSANMARPGTIKANHAVSRQSFPKEFKLFTLNLQPLKAALFSIVGDHPASRSTVISLPNVAGNVEQFEVFEASNFDPALQARFPEIRAYSGRGVTDKYASLKISISPQGIQTMVFRTGKPNEFIEQYSVDGSVYAVFNPSRQSGPLPWTCSTVEEKFTTELNAKVLSNNYTNSSAGELRTMRLAQSCNAEYSNYFGAFNASQVGLVLAAFNATLTRCNGMYERDLALHLNLIPNTDQVIYYDPLTDPYSNNLGSWNAQLQSTLNTVIGSANYDIGHMFGASGGGGNAGCIGCVCGTNKGSGITSPADGIPQGDNFDIDYVVHEVGHQLGGNHTFSMSTEGTGVNKEVGSGITIMGYAGITSQDVAPHSIAMYHETTIEQIQNNLQLKTCPVTTNITATNATPVVAPVNNYTIPISTPFALTGSATDANAGDALTYCWEQNNDGTGQTGNNSRAYITKPTGPNWLSFLPTSSPTRTFPQLSTILAGQFVTGPLPGGDAIATIEALSSIGRTLNFRLTVRDNSPYISTPPVSVGQTAYTDMVVTVTATSGPFKVTSPNTPVSWFAGSSQTITWDVANTTAAPVSCSNVNILLSTDGGLTFPVTLAANTTNDGSEVVTLPGTITTTARVKIESVGNIFFDISDANFSITLPPSGFTFTTPAAVNISCGAGANANSTVATVATGGFTTPINLTVSGAPSGTTASVTPNPLTPGNSATVTLTGVNTLTPGTYNISLNGIAGVSNQTVIVPFVVQPGAAPTIQTAPASQGICEGNNVSFSVTTTGATVTSYQWQISTNGGVSWSNIAGATSSSYSITGATSALNNNQYHVIVNGQCGTVTSAAAILTVSLSPVISTQPQNVLQCAGSAASFSVTASGAGLSYQWQQSTDGGGTWSDIPGAIAATYNIASVANGMNGYQYRVNITGTCSVTATTSAAATLTVGNASSITSQPASTVLCAGANASFTVAATGTNLTYQWQVSTDGGTTWTDITGATAAALSLNAVTAGMNNNQYHALVYSCTPVPIVSNAATLTVNTPVSIGTQPADVTICTTNAASFTAAASGTGLSYQWQYATSCTGTFSDIAGATSATYNIASAQVSNAGAYHVIVTGACGSVTSNCVNLTVNTPVVVSAQPVDASVCLPTNTTSFSVTASGTAVSYQWQVSINGGTVWTNVIGATSATLNLSGLTAAMNGYKYRVQLSGTCSAAFNSAVATLQVNSPVNITSQPQSAVRCSGDEVSFSVAATGSTITYQWQVSINNGPFVNIPNAIGTSISFTNLSTLQNGYRYRVIVSGVPCGAVISDIASLTVNQTPSAVLTLASGNTINPYIRAGLYVTVAPAMGNYGYSWIKEGQPWPAFNGSSVDLNGDDFGSYRAVVTNLTTGCSTTTNEVTLKAAGSDLVFIYPNPTKGQFLVRFYNKVGNDVSAERFINVYSSTGQRIWSKKYNVVGPYGRMDVDISNLSAGTYMVEVKDANGKKLGAGKVFKQ